MPDEPKRTVSVLTPPCPVCGNAMWLVMVEVPEPEIETSLFRCEVCKTEQTTDRFIKAN